MGYGCGRKGVVVSGVGLRAEGPGGGGGGHCLFEGRYSLPNYP